MLSTKKYIEDCAGAQDISISSFIADDILVYGCGETTVEANADHNAKLTKLFDRAREVNLKISRKKLRLRMTEL